MRGYDSWKTRSPDDQYAIDHPEKFRRGVYRVVVTRTVTAETTVEVEAASEEDARFDAVVVAKDLPLNTDWRIEQDDYDTTDVDGPPERDPDEERDERMDRDQEPYGRDSDIWGFDE
jgi:hypothetical protein